VKITGSRLSVPSKVTFGGIDVQEIRSQGDDALEVVLPTHGAGVVDVYVVAASGTVLSSRAFTYIGGDQNGDTKVDAIDVQLVTNGVLSAGKKALKTGTVLDANGDGAVNAADIQAVVGLALRR
jgi:hypothetical protein